MRSLLNVFLVWLTPGVHGRGAVGDRRRCVPDGVFGWEGFSILWDGAGDGGRWSFVVARGEHLQHDWNPRGEDKPDGGKGL